MPLSDLLSLAQLGLVMRNAQRSYFAQRKRVPHSAAEIEYRAAREAEKRFDSAVSDTLSRERQTLPGMEA